MKNLYVFFLKCAAILLVVGLIGCEGDIGQTGPAGPAGPQGPQGVAGADGQNGATTCSDCHGSNQLITSKSFQWENSIHYLGGAFERNQASCAGCHTSQGFLDRIASGEINASADVEDPLPQNCYTCHEIHQTYTQDDWELTAQDPVTFWVGGETADLGKGNLCISCHQPRIPSPALPTPGVDEMLEITSTRYGPHHGAQGTLFTGNGAYEVGEGYENSVHTTAVAESCITCHMATVFDGRAAGGHTFRVETEGGEINPAGCVMCHPDEDGLEALVESTQAGIESLLDSLGTQLQAIGIMNESGRSIPGTYSSTQVGVLYNYKFVEEDNSKGVHNAKYARTLLENSITALNE